MFWEELNVNKFVESLDVTGGVCVIPLGCMEKHGNHLPLGTDVYIAREVAARAAKQEEFINKTIVVLLPDGGDRYYSTELYTE